MGSGEATNWRLRAAAVAAVWCALVLSLIVVGTAIASSTAVARFDAVVTAAVLARGGDLSDTVVRVLTWLGAWPVLVVLVVVVTVSVRRVDPARRRSLAPVLVVAAAAVVGEEVAVRTVKEVVVRARPPAELWLASATGWSFPSGHVANAIVWWGVAVFVLAAVAGRRPSRTAVWVCAAAAGAVVAVTRVALGVHWRTDVVASAVFAMTWLGVVVLVVGVPTAALVRPHTSPSVVPGVAQVTGVRVPVEDTQ